MRKIKKKTEKEAVIQALDNWIFNVNVMGITLFVILILLSLYFLVAYITYYNTGEYSWLGKASSISLAFTVLEYVLYKISIIRLRALRIMLKN